MLRIEVGAGIDGAAELKRWIDEVSRKALGQRPPGAEPLAGTVHIEVTGVLYDYRVTLSTTRRGNTVGAPDEWTCDCSNDELLEKIEARIPGIASRLEVQEEPDAPGEPGIDGDPARGTESTPTAGHSDADGSAGRLGPVGGVGVALMTLGVLGVATGVPLIVLDEHPKPPSGEAWGRIPTRRYRPPGIVTAGVGAAVLVSGIIVYALRERIGHRRADAAVLVPSLDASDRLGVHVHGRF
ncbi:MAG: hypothetical protein KDK70_19685 [Myxococcales bacterium]|nr:hypothetical protein [Myxococcales bacterium]